MGKLGLNDARELFQRGTAALAAVQRAGVRVDETYLDAKIEEVSKEIHRVVKEELVTDQVWKTWKKRFKENANITSDDQLGKVLFGVMGMKPLGFTEKGKVRVDEAVLSKIDLPFVRSYLRMKKFSKVKSTYLTNLRRETLNGFFHPNFNLHLAQSYRSSSGSDKESESEAKDFNFQNIPVRNPETGPMVRKCFVPRFAHWLFGEVDESGVEVRVSACYNKDPTLVKYIKDPTTDMHRDTACELFFLTQEQAAAMKKSCRDWCKNRFVFPQFYGSVWFQCAPHLWEGVTGNPDLLVPGTQTRLIDHLKKHGIKDLGPCDEGGQSDPPKGTFARLVKDVEHAFWHKRFPVYTNWKKTWYNKYLERGYFDLLTGFRCEGVYRRNQVINYPVQGAAFHCLLWSLIRLVDWLKEKKFKTKIVGQIHDSIVFDFHPKEVQDVLTKAHQVMTKDLAAAWDWITVPLETESEVAPPGESWAAKGQWVEDSRGVWAPKA